jgi:hypothetical protein
MKRLLLISPLAPRSLLGADFYYRIPCLSLLRIAALTPPGWEVVVRDEKVERIDAEQEADLVGITAMTCSANRGYELAETFRRRGIPVIMGGIHASSRPDEALVHCDSVVIGEAEMLWPQVVRKTPRPANSSGFTGIPRACLRSSTCHPLTGIFIGARAICPCISSRQRAVVRSTASFAR